MTHKTHNDKGVPFNGADAMRTGWDTKANPWSVDSWQHMKWLSDWWGENAACFASHIDNGPVHLPGAPLTFVYRNWRGDVGTRTVQPIRLEYGATEWHPEPQWLLIAWDTEKEAERSFAIKDINPQHGELTSLVGKLFEVLDIVDWLPEDAKDLMDRIDALTPSEDAAPAPVVDEDKETAVLHFLVERLGGHQVRIVRPGVGSMVGFSISNRKTIAIRDLLDVIGLAAPRVETPPPQHIVTGDIEAEIASVVQSVNEWDDRTSPDDYPEHLLITSEELADILRNFAATIAAHPEK